MTAPDPSRRGSSWLGWASRKSAQVHDQPAPLQHVAGANAGSDADNPMATDPSLPATNDVSPVRNPEADSVIAAQAHTSTLYTERPSDVATNGLGHKTHALPPEVLAILSALDDRLVGALERGDIRFLRSAWLLAQPPEFRMVWPRSSRSWSETAPLPRHS
jgi:hypothetical protein